MELLCVQPSAAMDGVGTVYPSSWSHTHVPSVLPIPPTFPGSQSIHWLAQTSSHMEWGGNCHGRRAEGAGGSLWALFHQENAAPNVSGSICAPVLAAGSLPVRGSLWAGCLSPCLPSQIQAGCVLCGQSFLELWVCVEKGCLPGIDPSSSCLGCPGRLQATAMPSGACRVSPQAAGPVPGAEGVHAVPPGGGILPGPGAHRRRPAHAHAGRGTGTRLRGQTGTSSRVWGPLGGADEWGVHLRAIQSAPGVLCCFPPSPMAPGRRPQ